MWFKNANTERESMSWSIQKRQLKARFPSLTDADLNYKEDKKEEMLNHMQVKLAQARVQLNAVINWV